jgi:hypothetical protein
MKKLFYCLSFLCSLMALSFSVSSCTKDVTVEKESTQTGAQQPTLPHKYKIDGKEVEKDAFFATLIGNKASLRDLSGDMSSVAERYRVVEELARPEPTGASNVTNAFTETQAYIDYALSSGKSYVPVLETAYSDLATYAESSGAIASFEQTGVVPEDYMRYMNDYLRVHNLPYDNFGSGSAQTRSLTCSVNKDCNNQGAGWLFARNPWLGMFGFNDNISRFFMVGTGYADIFDRTFFRSRIVTIWKYRLSDDSQNPWSVVFCDSYQYANDRASSWFSM